MHGAISATDAGKMYLPIKIIQAGPLCPSTEAELRKTASNIFHKESQNQEIFLTSGILRVRFPLC